jgi:putative FmdB family regulatory protein
MPIFEFRCVDCGQLFEKLFFNSDEEVDLICPECGCGACDRVVSRANYSLGVGPSEKQPKLTTKSCGSSNQCMTLDLPGPTR